MIEEKTRKLDTDSIINSFPRRGKITETNSDKGSLFIHLIDAEDEYIEQFISKNAVVLDQYNQIRVLVTRMRKAGISVWRTGYDSRFWYTRYGNKWGSILAISDKELTIDQLQNNTENTIRTLKESGWESVKRISTPGKMARELLEYSTPSNLLPDLRSGEISERVLNFAYNCVKGGRMECVRAGSYDKVYDFDFCKAFLSVVKDLPSIRGSYMVWSDTTKFVPDAAIGFYLCRTDIPRKIPFGLVCFKFTLGDYEPRLYFPSGRMELYLCQEEVDLLLRNNIPVKILDGVYATPISEQAYPFYPAYKILEKNLKTGDGSRDPVISEIGSVLWGHFAHKGGMFYNPIYAAITHAKIRVKDTDVALMYPNDVIAFTIDGLVSMVKNIEGTEEIGKMRCNERKLISLSDFFRYDYSDKPWEAKENGVEIDAESGKMIVPYGSTKRIGKTKLTLSKIKSGDHYFRTPFEDDVVDLTLMNKQFFPEL